MVEHRSLLRGAWRALALLCLTAVACEPDQRVVTVFLTNQSAAVDVIALALQREGDAAATPIL